MCFYSKSLEHSPLNSFLLVFHRKRASNNQSLFTLVAKMFGLKYCINIFESIGMVATKPHPVYDTTRIAPLLKFLKITTASLRE